MVHPGSDAADETTHTTERPSMSWWAAAGWTASISPTSSIITRSHATLKLCSAVRTTGATYLRVLSVEMRQSQLDRTGRLYTSAIGPKTDHVGHRTWRPFKDFFKRWWLPTANKLRSTAEMRNKPSVRRVADAIRHLETMQERLVIDGVESGGQIE